MKNIGIVLLVILFVGAGCYSGQPTPTVSQTAVLPQTVQQKRTPAQLNQKFSDYISKNYKFVIGYPTGWTVDSLENRDIKNADTKKIIVGFVSSEPEIINEGQITEFSGYRANIYVNIEVLKKDFDSDYASFRAERLALPEAKITNEKREQIVGGVARFITMRWFDGMAVTQARYGFYKKDGENLIYTVQGTGTAIGYSTKYGKLIEDSVSSLQF